MFLRHLFQRIVLRRAWTAFVCLALSFLVFGATSYDLVRLLSASLHLIASYGWQAAMDGALRQLAELFATGCVAAASYVVLKTCEHRLSDWLRGDD